MGEEALTMPLAFQYNGYRNGEMYMDWLKDAIKNYDDLTDSQKAHVDATLDHLSDDPKDDGVCVCGTKDCPDAYAHTTSGY